MFLSDPLAALAFGLTGLHSPKILVFFSSISAISPILYNGISDACLTKFCSIGNTLEALDISRCSCKFLWEALELTIRPINIIFLNLNFIVSDSTLKLKLRDKIILNTLLIPTEILKSKSTHRSLSFEDFFEIYCLYECSKYESTRKINYSK